MSRILLIEPDRVLAKTYHEALQAKGHQVHTCGSAQAAIIAADQVCPELVIVELQLVTHSGAEFLYEFRSYSDWQHVPVIVHTNVAPSRLTANFANTRQQLGISEYLYKPQTSLNDLLTAVESVSKVGV